MTAGLPVAWAKAIFWARPYSTAGENCGLSSAPQPNPGYVQLWSVAMTWDKVLSTVMSCTDWGSCGGGSTMVTMTRPAAPLTGRLRTFSW